MGWLPYILMGILLTVFGGHRGPNPNPRKRRRWTR